MIQAETKRELDYKNNERTVQELFDSIRKGNIRIIGIQEREQREKETESLFKEKFDENFPDLG